MSLNVAIHMNILADNKFHSFDHFLQACQHPNFSSFGEGGKGLSMKENGKLGGKSLPRGCHKGPCLFKKRKNNNGYV